MSVWSLTSPAGRIPLRYVAFHEGICLGRFASIEALLKTVKCCRAAIERHPQRGAGGFHLKLVYRSKP
jgi:hypothetical protein